MTPKTVKKVVDGSKYTNPDLSVPEPDKWITKELLNQAVQELKNEISSHVIIKSKSKAALSSGSWTPPANTIPGLAFVFMQGGGGGGGGGGGAWDSVSSSRGGHGGDGSPGEAAFFFWADIAPNRTVNLVLGSGGSGGSAGSSGSNRNGKSGGSGGNTSMDGWSVKGGGPGTYGSGAGGSSSSGSDGSDGLLISRGSIYFGFSFGPVINGYLPNGYNIDRYQQIYSNSFKLNGGSGGTGGQKSVAATAGKSGGTGSIYILYFTIGN